MVLRVAQPSVGRSEKVGVNIGIRLVNVADIFACGVPHTAIMVESVVAKAMPPVFHHLKDVRILSHVVAHHEKRCLDVVVVKDVEHSGRNLWDRPIIKG